jgi:hypothetical protein
MNATPGKTKIVLSDTEAVVVQGPASQIGVSSSYTRT